jgi:hypothetical protein
MPRVLPSRRVPAISHSDRTTSQTPGIPGKTAAMHNTWLCVVQVAVPISGVPGL